MSKPYARTFRYSEETKRILEQYNNNLDEFVYECFERIEKNKKELKRLEDSRNAINSEIDRKLKDFEKLRKISMALTQIEQTLDFYKNEIKNVTQ